MKKIKAYGIVLYKIDKDNTKKILLCKSVQSKMKWGCFKGVSQNNETKENTAIREFYEESSIKTNTLHFKKYFEQKNSDKDIGVWLVDSKEIHDLEHFFNGDELIYYYLSWENSKAKFFNIDHLPQIRKKQQKIVEDIIDFLKNMH